MNELYSDTPKLKKARQRAKILCQEYNRLDAALDNKKAELLKKIAGKVGSGVSVSQPFYCDYGYNIEFGDGFSSGQNMIVLDCGRVSFGKNVSVAPNCGFYPVGHPLDVERRNEWKVFSRPITIGDNVTIGGNSVVLPGVTIGDNTVIEAGSVVTKNLPANVVAAGNPCKVILSLNAIKQSQK